MHEIEETADGRGKASHYTEGQQDLAREHGTYYEYERSRGQQERVQTKKVRGGEGAGLTLVHIFGFSLNVITRQRELIRIMHENRAILKRIHHVEASHDRMQLVGL